MHNQTFCRKWDGGGAVSMSLKTESRNLAQNSTTPAPKDSLLQSHPSCSNTQNVWDKYDYVWSSTMPLQSVCRWNQVGWEILICWRVGRLCRKIWTGWMGRGQWYEVWFEMVKCWVQRNTGSAHSNPRQHYRLEQERLESCPAKKDLGLLADSGWAWASCAQVARKANGTLASIINSVSSRSSAMITPPVLGTGEDRPWILSPVQGHPQQGLRVLWLLWSKSREGQWSWRKAQSTGPVRGSCGSWGCLVWRKRLYCSLQLPERRM